MTTRRVGNLVNTGYNVPNAVTTPNIPSSSVRVLPPFIPPGSMPLTNQTITQSANLPYSNAPLSGLPPPLTGLPPPFIYQSDTVEAVPSLDNEELYGDDLAFGCDDGFVQDEGWNCNYDECESSSSCSTDSDFNEKFFEDEESDYEEDNNGGCPDEDGFCCIEETTTSALCCEESQVCSSSRVCPCPNTDCSTSSVPPCSGSCSTSSVQLCSKSCSSTNLTSESESASGEVSSASTNSLALAKINNDTLKVIASGDILDICSYDSHYFVLTSDNIIKYNQQWQKVESIKTDVKLKYLDVFGGYIYAASSNELFTLDTKTYASSHWKWLSVKKYSSDIYMQSTLNGEILYIEMNNEGHLYTVANDYLQLSILESFELSDRHHRIYGIDEKHYIEINGRTRTAKKFPASDAITEILNGALNYNDDVVKILPHQQNKIKRVKIVDWEPYYIIYP